jgi:hypothetical protein
MAVIAAGCIPDERATRVAQTTALRVESCCRTHFGRADV